jgi:hypothetical protein
MSKEESFYMEEYKSLRQEIITTLKDRLEYSRWGLIGIAALYSYIISHPGSVWLFWVPVLFSVAMIFHFNEEHRMVDKAGAYIKNQIGPWVAGKAVPKGWEEFLAEPKNKTPRWWEISKNPDTGRWELARWPWKLWDWSPVPMWITLLIGTGIIAIVATNFEVLRQSLSQYSRPSM